MRLKNLTLITSLIAGAGLAHAAPPAFQDTRAFAMGGTGDGIAEKSQVTAGVALSPFGVRLEVSGLVGDGEVGAAAELGFMF